MKISVIKNFKFECKKCGNKHPDLYAKDFKIKLDQTVLNHSSLKVDYKIIARCLKCDNETEVDR